MEVPPDGQSASCAEEEPASITSPQTPTPRARISRRGKVFRDPVHGLIRLDSGEDLILDLIDSAEFQRLRRVRQLGVSSMTYPAAEHTRFAHSLGVFDFAKQIIAVLRRRYESDSAVTDLLDANGLIVKAAALLHDIGHGPFSHLIERAFPAIADHEKQTIKLIRDSGSIPSILATHDIDAEAVANIIRKTAEHRFLVDIVSSQLDADRMDYILRDSMTIGVRYGVFDVGWVLNSLCLGLEPSPRTETDPKSLRLCLEEKRGVPSAEQLVMARMHMSFQVYYHRVTRGWEAHLLCLLRLASDLAKQHKLPASTPSNVRRFLEGEGVVDGDDWLFFDESAKESALHAWAQTTAITPKLAELSSSFLLRKKVFHCAEIGELKTPGSMALTRALDKLGQDKIDWFLDDPVFTSYRDYDAGFRGPQQVTDEGAVSTGAILISEGGLTARARPAESVSRVLNALGENPQGTRKSLCRLYFHERLADGVRKTLAEVCPPINK
jgi:HD superfamily phosphohydrolase